MIELVAFDMAGTTIDDHGAVYEALEDAVVETGATVAAADLQEWMGTDKVEAITALMRLGGVEPDGASVLRAFERFRAILAESYQEQSARSAAGRRSGPPRTSWPGHRRRAHHGLLRRCGRPATRRPRLDDRFARE